MRDIVLNRRLVLLGFVALFFARQPAPALAGDGDSGGNSGSGSGNSGPGGGEDDSGDDHGGSGGHSGGDDDDDLDRNARTRLDAAVARGDIAPVSKIIRRALAHTPGRVLQVRMRRSGLRYVYRIRILASTGKRVELLVDSKTLAVSELH